MRGREPCMRPNFGALSPIATIEAEAREGKGTIAPLAKVALISLTPPMHSAARLLTEMAMD